MTEPMLEKLRKLLLVVAVPVGIYFLLSPRKRRPLPPPVPVVDACQELALGMRRIGNRHGIQFDVPIENFKIRERWGANDAELSERQSYDTDRYA